MSGYMVNSHLQDVYTVRYDVICLHDIDRRQTHQSLIDHEKMSKARHNHDNNKVQELIHVELLDECKGGALIINQQLTKQRFFHFSSYPLEIRQFLL